MGNRKIDDDVKECALDLWSQGWPLEEICETLQVSKQSCYRWRSIFEEHGTVSRPRPPSPPVGQTRILTHAALMALEDIYTEESDLFLDKACTWLGVQHGITITPSALSRNLLDAGLTREILREIAAERNEVAREEFRDMLQTQFIGDGSEFFVIGETGNLTDVFVRGDRYSFCAALTPESYFSARAIPGSFDAAEFCSFIAEDVLPNMNPFPESRSVIILDNSCRIHYTPELMDLVEGTGCLLLLLPPYSPDISPVAESFDTFKAYIRQHRDQLRQIPDPIYAFLEAAGCITPDSAENWFRNAGYIIDSAE